MISKYFVLSLVSHIRGLMPTIFEFCTYVSNMWDLDTVHNCLTLLKIRSSLLVTRSPSVFVIFYSWSLPHPASFKRQNKVDWLTHHHLSIPFSLCYPLFVSLTTPSPAYKPPATHLLFFTWRNHTSCEVKRRHTSFSQTSSPWLSWLNSSYLSNIHYLFYYNPPCILKLLPDTLTLRSMMWCLHCFSQPPFAYYFSLWYSLSLSLITSPKPPAILLILLYVMPIFILPTTLCLALLFLLSTLTNHIF